MSSSNNFNREGLMSEKRRQLIKGGTAAAVAAAVPGAWAQGSDAPEKKEVKIGLTIITGVILLYLSLTWVKSIHLFAIEDFLKILFC